MIKAGKRKEIIVSINDFEIMVAILEDRKLVEYYVEEIDKRRIVGNIYLGRVRDILPGMESAFIDIGLEKNAFLFINEAMVPEEGLETPLPSPIKIQQLLKPNQELLVQITREPVGTKGARVSAQLALPGRKLVLLPHGRLVGVSKRLGQEERERLYEICESLKPESMGLIARTAAENTTESELKADLDYLLKLWHAVNKRAARSQPPAIVYNELDLANRIVRDVFSADFELLLVDADEKYQDILALVSKTAPELKTKVKLYRDAKPLFEKYNIEAQLGTALERKVWLRSGGYIAIDRTEALTSIDVNTAKFVGTLDLRQTILKTNLEAAEEIVRQLRLRDIGGIIVIDFIDMQNPEDRETLFDTFNRALAEDRTKSRVIEISKLGLVEMTRKNISDGVQAHYYERCLICRGTGQVLSAHRASVEVVHEIESMAKESEAEAMAFELAPSVVDKLQENGRKHIKRLLSVTGKQILIYPNPAVELSTVKLIKQGSKAEVKEFMEAKK